MIAKEIEESLLEINPDFDIRTRTFGKSLLTYALDVKQTNKGRAYFVRAIVDDMKKYVETMDVDEVIDESKLVKKDKKKAEKGKGKDKKKEKNAIAPEEDNAITPATPDEAFDLPIDVSLLIQLVDGYDTLGEFEESLGGMSKTKLIKLINKHKLPVICEDEDEDVIVQRIMDVLIANLPKEDVSKSEQKTKKDKKDKKSKDKEKDDVIDAEALAAVGKKKDKKKDKKKNKK